MSEVIQPNKSNRNITLDVLKLVAAYMVVFIHVPFPGKMGALVDALARFAVPLFFISSGFFCYQNSLETIKKKIVNLLKLFVSAALIYFIFNIALAIFDGGVSTLYTYISGLFSVEYLTKFFLLNVTTSSYHLWFLPALIYAYIIQYLICKFNINDKVWIAFSVVGIALHIIFGEGLSAFGVIVSESLLRNFLLMGYPFFGMGLLLRKHKDKIVSIPMRKLLMTFFIGVLLTLVSRLLFGKNDLYIGILLVTFS